MWPDPNDGMLTRRETLACGSGSDSRDESRDAAAVTSSEVGLRNFMAVTKALADEQRVRVLLALECGELCVCQVVELMGLATSTVSKHMSILKQARLVDNRKQGRWIYYRRADTDAPPVILQAIAWVTRSLESDAQVMQDRQRLAAIRTRDPHELCVAQDVCRHSCK